MIKKILFTSCLLLALFYNCSKNDDFNDEGNVEINLPPTDINLPPTDFDISIIEIKHNSVLLKWNKSTDPENSEVKYSVYLENNLVKNNISELELKLENLTELTTYNGYIIAKDESNNESKVNFIFTTEKYYLTFAHYIEVSSEGDIKGIQLLSEVLITNDDNYIFAGVANKYNWGGKIYCTLKLDKNGNEIWYKEYEMDVVNSNLLEIKKTSDNGYIIVGDFMLLKLNTNGDLEWSKALNCQQNNNCGIESVVQTTDGGYIAAGFYSNDSSIAETTNIATVAYILKFDTQGNILWEKKIGDSFAQKAIDIIASNNGTYILFGSKERGTLTWEGYLSGNGYWDDNFWVATIDETGNLLKEFTYGDAKMDFPKKIIKTTDGNFVFVGNSWGAYNISESVIYKINYDGNLIWNTKFQYGNEDMVRSVTEGVNGELITIGMITYGQFGEMGLYKFDYNGILIWEKQYINLSSVTHGLDIKTTDDNGFIIASTYAKGPLWPYIPFVRILKTDPIGNFEE